jgi:hypothetical protein
MATPILDGKHASRGPGDKHRLSMQVERTGSIFWNVGKRRDSNFHGFSVLGPGSGQSVENPFKSLRQALLHVQKRCPKTPGKANLIVLLGQHFIGIT